LIGGAVMSKLKYNLNDYNFLELYKNESNPRVRMRFLGMQHKQEGKSFVHIAEILKVTRQAVMEWYQWFSEYGIDGLYDDQRRGRTPFLARGDEDKFLKELDDLQSKNEGGRATAKDIQKMLEEKFSAKYEHDSVYRLLERLNVVWITGRSIHPKADKEAQEEFKKKVPRISQRSHTKRYFSR